MDWFGWTLTLWWLALALVFGWGWIRGGNGAWRWQQDRDDIEANAPLYGVMAFVFLSSALWLGYSSAHYSGLPVPGRNTNRWGHEVPLLILFTLIALARKPWKSSH